MHHLKTITLPYTISTNKIKFRRYFIMSKVQIKVMNDGPYRVTGDVELIDADGNVFEVKPAFSLCRCGISSKLPYCDGTHKGQFESHVEAPKDK
jgi:CDGSH-type Zn-finger protein